MQRKVDPRSFKDGAVKKTYPPKIVANPKSSAFSGTRSEVPRASRPVQSPASHGWARRSRLRELRIRCVARKFLYLWIRMTFGRVVPSKARFYYEQRILQKAFEEWKEEWWVLQREWKLCVRADCHYRYYLYNLMFQAWRAYVHQQQVTRSKHVRARNHDARQKKRQAWKSWLIYVVFRRTKRQMQTTALEFRQRSILWLSWSQWRLQLAQVRVGHALLASAVEHRAQSLQRQAWSRWWDQLRHVWRERRKMVSAVKHHQHWQKWKSLKAWLEYLRARRVKRQHKEMAARFHQAAVLRTQFCDWQWAWERKRSLSAQLARVEALARRVALRRAFTHWKHYVLLCAREAAQREVAEGQRRHTLLRFCFRALQDNVTRARLQQIRRNLAHQQHGITLLHRFWELWQSRLEQREEREQLPLLCAAWDHCRITLLRKCIGSWLRHIHKRRYKQLATFGKYGEEHRTQCRVLSAQHCETSTHHSGCGPEPTVTSSSGPCLRPSTPGEGSGDGASRDVFLRREQRAFTVLREQLKVTNDSPCKTTKTLNLWEEVRLVQEKQLKGTSREEIHTSSLRDTLEKQVLAVWWQKMLQRRENRLAERMAILHSERQLLQRSWSMWHRRAAAQHRERQWTAAAGAHRRHRQLGRAFCIWRDSARALRTQTAGLVLATDFHAARLLHWAWNRWAEGLAKRAAEAQRLTRARLHQQHASLRGALRTWATYQSQVRSILQEVAARGRQHEARLLRNVFRSWRESTLARVHEARQSWRASAHYRRSLCAKVLARWQEAASVQIDHRQRADCAVQEAQEVLRRGCLRTWFRRWRDRGQSAAQQRAQLWRAAAHHRRRLLLWAVAQWRAHHLGCVRKRLLQWRGAQLLAQTRSRACFRRWRQQLASRRREQRGTARALWFWSFSLQAKVWAAWRVFALERRRKKGRQEQAMQAYQRQLLREGATRLLRFAGGTKALRQQLRAQQEVQAAHSLHRAVRRCAMLWKRKVLGQDREPRPPTAATPRRRVTFDSSLSACAAGAGDAALETRKPPAPHEPRGALGSLALAAGDPHFLELNAARLARKQPRRPHFLLGPVPSRSPLGCGILGGKGPEAPREHDPRMARPAGPAPRQPFLPVAWTALGPRNPLPQPKALPTRDTGPELLPPSSFVSCGLEAPARASAQRIAPGPTPQALPSPANVPRSRLLLPGDFTATGRGPGWAATIRARGAPSAGDPCVQPWPSLEDAEGPACSDAKGHPDLEAELEAIQRQLQNYRALKQNLSSCQRQARSLRRWLELSQEEPRPEDREAERQVQGELQEVQWQIQQLASELQAQRQPVRACTARIQALRRALC